MSRIKDWIHYEEELNELDTPWYSQLDQDTQYIQEMTSESIKHDSEQVPETDRL